MELTQDSPKQKQLGLVLCYHYSSKGRGINHPERNKVYQEPI